MIKYTINLVDKGIGSTCEEVKIDWVTPLGCVVINSISKDGKKITVTYPDGCNERIQAVVSCKDECQDCPTEIINIQPCENSSECPDCEECIGGLCVSICEDGNICDGNRCVECITAGQCPGNQICVAGGCTCPPGLKKYKGNCVECTPHDKLSDCDICVNGLISRKDCGNLHLDPITCDCVSCVNSGHCPPNETCVYGGCECAPGYRRNSSGLCVKKDKCSYDSDCGNCESCHLGNCVPKTCPSGYGCVDDNCLEICDPDNPRCRNGNCVDMGDDFYCMECSGTCNENSDCGVSCYCNGDICVKNPGYKLCVDKDDCLDGYGCDPSVNSCVPCSSMSCENCSNGCYCDNGEDCLEIMVEDPGSPGGGGGGQGGGDDGSCNDGSDCPIGEGCLDGECVKCSEVDCDENGDCPVGCECGDEGKCQTVKHNDDDCIDGVKLDKTDCGLKGESHTVRCCECATIGIGYEVVSDNSSSYDIEISLRKGVFSGVESLFNKQTLDMTGVFNDMPTSGSIELYAKVYRAKYYKPGDMGSKILSPEIHTEPPVIATVANKAIVVTNIENSYPLGIEEFHSIDSGGHKVYIKTIKVEIYARVRSTLSFDNECRYTGGESLIFKLGIGDIEGERSFQETTKQTPCRKPLLKFYKSDDRHKIFKNNPFFQVYAYSFELDDFLEHGIEPLYFYGMRSDCGCNEDAIYECGKLVFCTPEGFDYKLNSCGTELEFTSPVEIGCQLYMDSGRYPKYELLINNQIVGRTTPSDKTIFYSGTKFSLSSGDIIEKVVLRIAEDECNLCLLEENVDVGSPSGDLDMGNNVCSAQSNMTFKYLIEGGEPPYTVTIKDPASNTYSYVHNAQGVFVKSETQPGTITGSYNFKIVDNNSCEFTKVINYDEVGVGDNYDVNAVCSPNLGISFKNNDLTQALFYIVGQISPVIVNPGETRFYPLPAGTYSIEITPVVDGSNVLVCQYTGSVPVDCCKGVGDNDISAKIVASDLEISVINNNAGPVTYEVIESPSSSKGSVTLVPGTYHKFTGLDENKTHFIKATSQDGLACPDPTVFTYDPLHRCDDFDNNVTVEAICSGTDKYVRVNNPTGLKLQVEIDSSSVEPGSTAETQNFPMNSDPSTVKVTDIDSGCNNTVQLTKDCCVNLPPIEPVYEECYRLGGDIYRIVKFNHVSSVKDNNGSSIQVVNNEIDFNTSGLTSITATYISGGCTTTLVLSNLTDCPCLDIQDDISVTTTPGGGVKDGQFTVNNGNNHVIQVFFEGNIIYNGSSSFTKDIDFGHHSVKIKSGSCEFVVNFELTQECECEQTGGWYKLQDGSGFYSDVDSNVSLNNAPIVKLTSNGGTKYPPGGMSHGDGTVAGYGNYLYEWLKTVYGSANVIVVTGSSELDVYIRTCDEELTAIVFGNNSFNFDCGNPPV